jgi:hypothetical protein
MTAIYALVATADHAWTSAAVLGPAGAAVAMVIAFIVLESRLANPLMPLRILKIRTLIASSVVRGFLIMGIYGVFFFGVLELSHGLAFGPLQIGLAFLPQTLTIAALSLGATAWLIGKFGARRMLLAGLSLIVVSLVTFAMREPTAAYWPGRFMSYGLLGIGSGLAFLPLLTLAMSEVPARDAGLGSAIVNLSLQLSAAVDIAILAAVSAQRTKTLVAAGMPAAQAALAGIHSAYGTAAIGVTIGTVVAAVVLPSRVTRRAA